MTYQILGEALQMEAPLNEMLKSAVPSHTLDVVSAASLGALCIAYLFPKYTWNKPDPYEYIYHEKPQSGEHTGGANKVTRNIAKYLEETVRQAYIGPTTKSKKSLAMLTEFLFIITGERRRHLLGLSVRHGRSLCRETGS
jgi:hypothetical protein